MQTNSLSSKPTCKPMLNRNANQCQTISGIRNPLSGIRNPGQYDCCVSSLRHLRSLCVSTSFRFRIGRLEFNKCPEQRNGLKLLPQQQQRRCLQPERCRRQAPEVSVEQHLHFGHEGCYGGPQIASGGAWNSSSRSWPIGKVHSIFSFGCKIKAIKSCTSKGNINNSVIPSSSSRAL